MYIFRLAYRNLFGKGLRSWLNFLVLSFAYVAIIWMTGLQDGMQRQAGQAMVSEQIGAGQYWAAGYDPYDPFSLDSAYVKIPDNLAEPSTPILLVRAIAYPQGQMRAITLKGIEPEQQILDLPAFVLQNDSSSIPGFIGKRMAQNSGLQVGDLVTVRWKNSQGAYDAREIEIVQISAFQTPAVDNNQIWLELQTLQKMVQAPDTATIITLGSSENSSEFSGWEYKDLDFLMRDINAMVKMKKGSSLIFHAILLFLAVISIFDTQILNLFRRRREMGTMMALGLTRSKLTIIFTLEGFLNAVMAALIGAVYGIPLLYFSLKYGIALPAATDDYNIAGLSTKLYPYYSAQLIVATVLLIFLLVILVSYLPARKISKLRPTEALRGKWTTKEK
ncbi:MAG: FtsX-like permease family protein [Candidatus Cloacimonadales bacterium]